MTVEGTVQSKIIKHLKSRGFYVIKTRPGPGTPKGCLDIIFMKEGFWGAIECKAYPNSKWQVLQPETFAKFSDWSWARVAHSENIDEIKAEIDQIA